MDDKKAKGMINYEIQTRLIKKNLLSAAPTPANEDYLVGQVTSAVSTGAVEDWREFFLMDYSRQYVAWIAATLYKEDWRFIQGQYYVFISAEGGEANTPYYKVSQFQRKRDASLRRYLSLITLRHFVAEKEKEKKIDRNTDSIDQAGKISVNFSGNEVIENPWYALLIYDGETDRLSANDLKLLERLKKAISQLPQKEQLVIQRAVYEDRQGDEIYDELYARGLVEPTRDIATLTAKNKQDAVANIRKRAIKHLQKLMER